MPLTRDYKETINERAQSDPDFAKGLLDEALELFINGEPEVARIILRDLVNSTIDFVKKPGPVGKQEPKQRCRSA